MKNSFLVLLVLCAADLFGQNAHLFELQKRASSFLERGQNEAARADFEATFQLFKNQKKQPDSLFTALRTGLAATFFEKNPARAEAILTDALQFLFQKGAAPDRQAELYLAFGKCAFSTQNWARADSFFQKAARLASPQRISQVAEARGNLAFAQNQLDEAANFFKKSLEKAQTPTRRARLWQQLGLVFLQKGDSRRALESLEHSRRERSANETDGPDFWRFLLIEGQAFLAAGAVDSALLRAENALALVPHEAENAPIRAATFALMGDAFVVLKEWAAAAQMLATALDLTKNEVQKANLALKMAHASLQNRRLEAAAAALKMAQKSLRPDSPPSLFGLCAVVEARLFFEKKQFAQALAVVEKGIKKGVAQDPATELRLLIWRAKILQKTGDEKAVLAAWQRADERLAAWLGALSPLSRPEVESLFFEVREGLISAFLAQNEVEKAFFATDRSHAALISGSSEAAFSLENLAKKLGHETVLIEYFWGADQLFAFVFEDKKLRTVRLGSVDSLAEPILDFWRLCSVNPQKIAGRDAVFSSLLGRSSSLFERLVRPLGLSEGSKNVRIVPSGLLWILPFEALSTRPTVAIESDRHYFLKLFWLSEKTISYLPSASFLFKKQGKTTKSDVFSAFRPAFGGDGRPFSPLEHSAKEIESIRSFGPFEVFENEEATVSAFVRAAEQSAILHASTHAVADGQRRDGSRLILALEADGSGGELSAEAILSMQIPAEMVVLSACQTSVGRVYRGEGAWSLARAFLQAGARSAVTTLWQVDDNSTQRIVSDFYANLADGQSRAEALRQAKMAEIERENGSFWQTMPFYWASMALVGESGEMPEFSFFSTARVWAMAVFALSLVAVFWFFWRRKRQRG